MALSDRPYGPTSGAASVANQIPLNQQATQTQTQAGTLPVTQLLVANTETQLMSAPNAAVPLSIVIPPNTQNEQTVFDLFASGMMTVPTASTNVELRLYEGASTTIGDNTVLGASGVIAQSSTTAGWWIHAQLIYESVTSILSGKIEFYINKILVAAVTLSNFPTAIDNTDSPVATFSLTAQSSAAAPSTPTTVNVQKFSVG